MERAYLWQVSSFPASKKGLIKIPLFEIIRKKSSGGFDIHDLSSEWHLRHPEWGRDRFFDLDILFDFYDFEREKINLDETLKGEQR
ncbi:hypothetical protein KYJ26_12225 [Bacillus sp. MCCB 382]|uniref:hypothetical protein n=1 Tax=Bacillus sp. MCCB 382 TaxID=2860197 RepID=UPI001C57212A|nr:hypothetical protein [Bacillus sp. MCCB 382]